MPRHAVLTFEAVPLAVVDGVCVGVGESDTVGVAEGTSDCVATRATAATATRSRRPRRHRLRAIATCCRKHATLNNTGANSQQTPANRRKGGTFETDVAENRTARTMEVR